MPRRLMTSDGVTLSLREFEPKPLGPREIQVTVSFASPKHGTEKNLLAGNPFVGKRWDGSLRMFLPRDEAESPTTIASAERTLGNMVVGTVAACGTEATQFSVGDRVYGNGPIAEIVQSNESGWRLLGNLTEEAAVCLDPAHVALVAVRDGQIRLGDVVVVYGLGAIGLLIVQCARASGARVFAVDPVESRRTFALQHGAELAFDPITQDTALEIKKATDKIGADVSLETSGNGHAMHDAIRCLRPCGTMVHVAWGPRDASALRLDEEFHHNRISIIGSQAVWGNPDRDHPRWDIPRVALTLEQLFLSNTLVATGLVTPIANFDQAPEILGDAFANPAAAIKIGVRF
jgi:threonine dehydrogenase-like Zn-dependent dehydrogenase